MQSACIEATPAILRHLYPSAGRAASTDLLTVLLHAVDIHRTPFRRRLHIILCANTAEVSGQAHLLGRVLIFSRNTVCSHCLRCTPIGRAGRWQLHFLHRLAIAFQPAIGEAQAFVADESRSSPLEVAAAGFQRPARGYRPVW